MEVYQAFELLLNYVIMERGCCSDSDIEYHFL